MTTKTNRNCKSGFTLIELLIVIAIIAILAAILFPAFSRARENARRSSCQSNEKQIAMGFHQYLQDNDEKYPAVGSWKAAIDPYTKSTQILRCPSTSAAATDAATDVDYLYNGYLDTLKEAKVDFSTSTILNAEATRGAAASGTTASAGTRHFEGANYSFVDGHVKWLKPVAIDAAVNNGAKASFVVTGVTPASGGGGGSTGTSFPLNNVDIIEFNFGGTSIAASLCTASPGCEVPCTSTFSMKLKNSGAANLSMGMTGSPNSAACTAANSECSMTSSVTQSGSFAVEVEAYRFTSGPGPKQLFYFKCAP